MIPYADVIVVFITAFVIASWLWSYLSTFGGKLTKLPPGPTPWPVLGNLPSLLGEEPHRILTDISEAYDCGVFTFHLWNSPVVVINRLEQAVEAFVKQDAVFADRRIPPLMDKAFTDKGSLLWENGPRWRQNRRNVHSGIHSFESGNEDNLTSRITSEMKHVFKDLDEIDGPAVDLSRYMMTLSAKVACIIAFGGRSSTTTEDETFTNFLSAIKTISNNLSPLSLAAILPPIYDTFIYRKVRSCVETFRDFIDDNLREHKRLYKEGKIRDIMDAFCASMAKQSSHAIKEGYIWRGYLDLLGAGTDTTANTLLWCVAYMCAYPEYQQKIFEEMTSVCGNDDITTTKLRDKLPLTQAVLLEVMRRAPVAPLGLPRVASRETVLCGYDIPKGTEIWMNIYAIHHDKNMWENPEEFFPERFLDQQKTAVLSEAKNRLVSFGLGSRICVGRKVAEIELFIIFSNLFKRYSISFAEPDQRFDPVGVFGITYGPKPFEVKLAKR